jgi:hypothetical protein
MIDLSDPVVLKAGAGVALYTLGGSRAARLAGLALAGWAAWEYFGRPKAPALQQGAPALMPFTSTPTSSGSSPEASAPGSGGKVIPFRKLGLDDRMVFYGIGEDDAG